MIRRRPFSAYLGACFLGAFNDNAFKFFTMLLLSAAAVQAGTSGTTAVAVVGGVVIFPFLLFAAASGGLADRNSKGRSIVFWSVVEIGGMTVAAAGFLTGSTMLLWTALFLMGTQSAFFSPSKYGYMPETVPSEDLSLANGALQAVTVTAILLGTAAGGAIGTANPGAAAVLVVFLAAAGTACAWFVERPPAANPAARVPIDPITPVLRTLRKVRPDPTIFQPILATAWFWLLGALVQGVLIVLCRESLGFSEGETGIVVTALTFGIAGGALLAARWMARPAGARMSRTLVRFVPCTMFPPSSCFV